MGNLTKKQAQHVSGKKIQQNKNLAGKLNGQAGRHILKNKSREVLVIVPHFPLTPVSSLMSSACPL